MLFYAFEVKLNVYRVSSDSNVTERFLGQFRIRFFLSENVEASIASEIRVTRKAEVFANQTSSDQTDNKVIFSG